MCDRNSIESVAVALRVPFWVQNEKKNNKFTKNYKHSAALLLCHVCLIPQCFAPILIYISCVISFASRNEQMSSKSSHPQTDRHTHIYEIWKSIDDGNETQINDSGVCVFLFCFLLVSREDKLPSLIFERKIKSTFANMHGIGVMNAIVVVMRCVVMNR